VNVLVIFGTRPEAIKMAPIIHELERVKANLSVCVTGQHRFMLDQVLNVFGITPEFDLEIMEQGQSLVSIGKKIFDRLPPVIKLVDPDVILVHGDTSTSSFAAQVAFNLNVPVAHVEAGLRTFDLRSPWPEEANRQIVRICSDIHFCPTEMAAGNLRREHVAEADIFVTGNTVIDALMFAVNKIAVDESVGGQFLERHPEIVRDRETILVTGHRRENFGQGFESICNALRSIALDRPETQIVYPVHLNPNVKLPVYEILSGISNVFLIEPQGYLEFIYLMSMASLIITDSGGIQEEAPSLGKPVIVMRDTSERPEAEASGHSVLVGTDAEKIRRVAFERLRAGELTRDNPYGDGQAARRIVDALVSKYK
jgi:UDP-N-acetylglucosamine 2-epimerase (non-hydrolysing)